MIVGRAAVYFDEVARRGSIRRASEHLNIAPSAVDRQIIQLEQHLGIPLFERMPQGLRLTAAGEILLEAVRRSRRDFGKARSQIDLLQGLRRGEVGVALVEGATELLMTNLAPLHAKYPAIAYRIQVASSQTVMSLLLSGEHDVGLTFDPPESHALRVERAVVYQLGAVVLPDHPLAGREQISLAECADYPLIIPDESISLRQVLNKAWARSVGGNPSYVLAASGVNVIKSAVKNGMGVGILATLDAFDEINRGELSFIGFSENAPPYSVLALVSASGRTLSVPASMLLQHLSTALAPTGVASV